MNNTDPNRSADRQRVSPYNDSRKILKYELNKNVYKQLVSMPLDAEILHVDSHNEKLCVWVLATPCNKLVNRQFTIYMTGECMNNTRLIKEDYIGTVIFAKANYVVHVFEMGITDKTAEELFNEVSTGRE